MSDYSLKLTIRNARILRAIKAAGYKSQSDCARAIGMGVSRLNALIGMRKAPVTNDGRLSADAQQLCDALCLLPEDLWSQDQLYAQMEKNTFEAEVTGEEFRALIEGDRRRLTNQLLSFATDREARVLRLHLGLETDKPLTYEQISDALGVTRERIRQIEAKGLLKIRGALVSGENGPLRAAALEEMEWSDWDG